MNTRISYRYRDGSNYKVNCDVVLLGELRLEDKAKIMAARNDGEFFIPSQVGLDDLQGQLAGFPDQDDHVWHELLELQSVEEEADMERPTAAQFLDDMLNVKGEWKVKETSERLGIK